MLIMRLFEWECLNARLGRFLSKVPNQWFLPIAPLFISSPTRKVRNDAKS
jgi:hypothetical protein